MSTIGRTILFVHTVSNSERAFHVGQFASLQARGIRIHSISSGDPEIDRWASDNAVVHHSIRMAREPSPARDLLSLGLLAYKIWRLKPRAVVYGTPKASLLTVLASSILKAPRRVYVVHGLRYQSTTGAQKSLLKFLEWLTCVLSTDVVAVSPSVADSLVKECGVRHRPNVLGYGSVKGVDGFRFRVPTDVETQRARAAVGAADGATVLVYVGRVNRDKGLYLFRGIMDEVKRRGEFLLVIVGRFEGSAADRAEFENLIARSDVLHAGVVSDPENYLAAADLMLFPSAREGLPSAVLEAGAMGIPVIGSDVDGVRDVIEPGVSGVLVGGTSVSEWAAAIDKARGVSTDRKKVRGSVIRRFSGDVVNEHWSRFLVETVG